MVRLQVAVCRNHRKASQCDSQKQVGPHFPAANRKSVLISEDVQCSVTPIGKLFRTGPDRAGMQVSAGPNVKVKHNGTQTLFLQNCTNSPNDIGHFI
jgi:hypothetical protein